MTKVLEEGCFRALPARVDTVPVRAWVDQSCPMCIHSGALGSHLYLIRRKSIFQASEGAWIQTHAHPTRHSALSLSEALQSGTLELHALGPDHQHTPLPLLSPLTLS